jgi:hypothetical protein
MSDNLPANELRRHPLIIDNLTLETLLQRKQLALALTERGFETSPATLATMACRGGGPPFRKFGRKPLYKWGDALEWAEARLSAPVHSTSELDAGAGR